MSFSLFRFVLFHFVSFPVPILALITWETRNSSSPLNLLLSCKITPCYGGVLYVTDIRCDNLSTPSNGEITSCSSGRVGVGYEGETCSFTCNTGYELTGSDTRTCQSNGSWSGSDDVCRRGMFT